MNQEEFDGLHTGCTAAFVKYAGQAERTSTMLADCTAEPMPFEALASVTRRSRAMVRARSNYAALAAPLTVDLSLARMSAKPAWRWRKRNRVSNLLQVAARASYAKQRSCRTTARVPGR